MVLTPNEFCSVISSRVKQTLTENEHCAKNSMVSKQKRDLKFGDFIVPRGCVQGALDDKVLQMLKEAFSAVCLNTGFRIKSVSSDQHHAISLSLDRSQAFQAVVNQVLRQGEKYCTCSIPEKSLASQLLQKTIILHVPDLCDHSDEESSIDKGRPLSISYLRTITLMQHVRKLLLANGFQVQTVQQPLTSRFKELFEVLRIDCHEFHCPLGEEAKDSALIDLVKSARDSAYSEKRKKESSSTYDTAESKQSIKKISKSMSENDDIVINLRQYIGDKTTDDEKILHGFSKNIHLVDVVLKGQPTDRMKQVHCLEGELSRFQSEESADSQGCLTCLHLTSHSRSFMQQQVDLLWRLLSSNSRKVRQVHLVHGPVVKQSSASAKPPEHPETVVQYYSFKESEMREAAIMKYGDQVHGDGWDDTMSALTLASIKFELLSTTAKNPVKVNVFSGEGSRSQAGGVGGDKKCGTFVMYNCARLATLFSHFDQAVTKGIYPPLPPIGEIDFSLLKEEEEWCLLFSYVWSFPDVIQETVADLETGRSKFTVDIQTHKVCNYLMSLSQQVSSYYSRIHILGESRVHLYSLMYARLYLLKAVHQVMKNGLELLDIEPLSQL